MNDRVCAIVWLVLTSAICQKREILKWHIIMLKQVNATMMAFANNQDEAGKYIEQLVLVRLGRALPV